MRSLLPTRQLKRFLSFFTLISGLVVWALIGASTAQADTVPASFVKYASSPVLRNPGILVVDPTSKATIYSKSPDVLRAPASVLKLFSMSTVLHTISPNTIFTTTIFATSQSSTYVLIGDTDPWLTSSPYEAKKYHRAFLPSLMNTILADKPKLKSINLQYFGLNGADAKILKRFFTGRVKIRLIPLKSLREAKKSAKRQIARIKSPQLSKIVDFTLLYSDNKLADRLVKMASYKLGFGTTADGIKSAVNKTLNDLRIPTKGLVIEDGNGLSHSTRVSVRQIADLLVAIKRDPQLKVMYEGLPIAGKTGTLKNRFRTDAPNAVGLIHAKTGWIDNTVSLAGYVSVGKRQYVFAVVADHIQNSEIARQVARITIDKMLGTLARKGS
jgi:D-alanyl-D-alanine carboxypeptidase